MGIKPTVSVCRQFFFKNNVSLCAVGPVEGEQSEVLQECPSEWPLALSSSLRSSPVGPAVCLCDIFICKTAMPPQRDWTVCERWAMTLSLAILSQKSCQGKCAVRLSFFTHPPLSSLHHPTPVFLVRSISGHTTLCSPETLLLLFFMFCPVDTYYSSAAFAAQSPMFCLQGSSTERV